MERKLKQRAQRRAFRVRNKVKDSGKLRLSVFKSLNHIYGQIINDQEGKTLISCSSLEIKDLKGDKKAIAFAVGKELAKKAKSQGIESVAFDRGDSMFHGRLKALADGAIEGGLKI
ncbi:50S ribosomal protein L18 [Candidatus Dependentiae bacterium]|nr:50S ribosomal protein L18 [Candidatus Dependentiae bacterium]